MPSPLKGLMVPPASPTTSQVGTAAGPDRQAHRQAPAGRRTACGLGPDVPRGRGVLGELLQEVGGVDRLPLIEGREQADPDVDPAVADRKDPAVTGEDVAGLVADVQPAVDPRLVVAGRGPVAPDGHAEGVGPVAAGAEGPAEAGSWPRPPPPCSGRGLRPADRRHPRRPPVFASGPGPDPGAAHQAGLDDGLQCLRAVPDRRPGLDRPLRHQGVEVLAGDDVAVAGEVGVVGPGQLEGPAEAVGAQPREAVAGPGQLVARGPCPRAGEPNGGSGRRRRSSPGGSACARPGPRRARRWPASRRTPRPTDRHRRPGRRSGGVRPGRRRSFGAI